jgi:hypothetical protein
VLKAPRKKIRDLTKELNQLLSEPMGTDNTQQQAEVTRLIEIALEQEEMHYMQRSRANWLLNGDRNTMFFQNFAKAHRKRNAITKLQDENGDWKEGNEEIGAHIKEYFSLLFQTEVLKYREQMLHFLTAFDPVSHVR